METDYNIALDAFSLIELIEYLESLSPATGFDVGFHRPHSYRGYYEDLAFEPCRNTVADYMLREAKSALGQTFEGYKGGSFTMKEYTRVWLAYEGHSGGMTLSILLLDALQEKV